ncbi:Rieske 2Fe-2S domain-containing protein [Prescottella agglutinans]|uniref:Phenylpropionate dioxygenase-like ring-hydroxylating dioxygenase large terminal subunit n=1 Tax=Prescottella agglutinans TaxID=1644129 RepID=A0ABT6MDE3_9NOCA|nr:Rieske 2Fe-2S domain-containing protein [Prescottella agglutinans]MDH6282323.1 phenylpropionate dioxygenase-like ring-hydroxylating dioxygenase large terminal subunit [Prescottella agglutinans]
MTTTSHSGSSAGVTRQYAPYVKADWGYANHWYPALLSDELEDGTVKGITIGGHDIAVRRSAGKAYALSDRCIHRGVKLSAKPMCLSEGTITCWYHGFTYGLEDGSLTTIVGNPEDSLIGNAGIRTYPVEEVNGIIYVFVGDEDYGTPPPLSSDLPARVTNDPNDTPVPHLLDEGIVIRGIHRKLVGNWRLAAENGLDPGHLLVHWDNQILVALDRALPLGVNALTDSATEEIDIPDGPKGVMNRYDRPDLYKPVLDNPKVNMKARGTVPHYFRTSLWVPGVLMVEHWPITDVVQYEFYVPIDDHHHEYWEIIATRATSDEEIAEFNFKYDNFMLPLALEGFNNSDVFAREATEEHYTRFDGWNNEVLCDMDYSIVAWRKMAARHPRGFFESPFQDED